jgi:hypothetical protein
MTSIFVQLNSCGYSYYLIFSPTRKCVSCLQLLLVLDGVAFLDSESYGTHDHILLSQIRDFPKLEGQVPVFISHRNRGAQLYPQTLCSLFFASYESQGYGGGIRTRLHPDTLQSKSNSKLLYDWRFTANQFVLESSPLRHTTRDLFPPTEPLRY